MKQLQILFMMMLITVSTAFAQAPNMINYQGVARNGSGDLIANQQIRLRFKVRNLTSNGTVVYNEVRKATTNANGLFSVQIGGPGVVSSSGNFSSIPWGSGAKYLQVEMDPAGGTAYVNMGTQQIVSVPYASFSNTAAALDPAAKINPSQIGDGGASNGQVLSFDGTNWVPANAATGVMTLPFMGQGSADSALFTVTNTHNDAMAKAIKGEVTNGIGIFGHSANNQGVYGSTDGASYAGVMGYTYNQAGTGVQGRSYAGTGVLGETTASGTGVRGVSGGSLATAIGVKGESNAATGFGVMGVNNNGAAIKGVSNGTTAGAVGVIGESNNANGTGVFGSTLQGVGVKGVTNATNSNGAGVKGENTGTSGDGVLGVGNNVYTNGVRGTSINGKGVVGYSETGTAVHATSYSGTAVKAINSTNGYALDVDGKVRISGGSTNPGNGKVLTSDASGNATWANPAGLDKVAFRASSIAGNHLSMPEGAYKKVEYNSESYDLGNNFTPSSGSTSSTSGAFTAPVSGIYSLTAQVELDYNLVFNTNQAFIRIIVNRAGNNSVLAERTMYPVSQVTDCPLVTTEVKLLAGDVVWVEFKQANFSQTATNLILTTGRTYFCGHLIFKD